MTDFDIAQLKKKHETIGDASARDDMELELKNPVASMDRVMKDMAGAKELPLKFYQDAWRSLKRDIQSQFNK